MMSTFPTSFRRLALALFGAATVFATAHSQDQVLSTSSEARTLFQELNQRYVRENVDQLAEIDQAFSDALTGLRTENSARLNGFLDQQRAEIEEQRIGHSKVLAPSGHRR